MHSINHSYRKRETIERIREQFPAVSLQKFLAPKTYQKLQEALTKAKGKRMQIPPQYSYTLLDTKAKNILASPEVRSFLSQLLKRKIKKITLQAYSFQWKDYTLVHDKQPLKPGIDLIFDCTNKWNNQAGGNMIYKLDTDVLIHPSPNTLTIIKRKRIHENFLQYINHKAKKQKRLLILGEIIV